MKKQIIFASGIIIILILASLSYLVFGLSFFSGEEKINPELSQSIEEDPKKEMPVIIQLQKEEQQTLDKIKTRGKIKESLDTKLILADISGENLKKVVKDS
ncbi:hypothetical protein HYT51_00315, partial [Candidatus Woesearchaeota archaeon]|nr:hypothetical protein [Candidatus Woesearchaeota archaeon]